MVDTNLILKSDQSRLLMMYATYYCTEMPSSAGLNLVSAQDIYRRIVKDHIKNTDISSNPFYELRWRKLSQIGKAPPHRRHQSMSFDFKILDDPKAERISQARCCRLMIHSYGVKVSQVQLASFSKARSNRARTPDRGRMSQ